MCTGKFGPKLARLPPALRGIFFQLEVMPFLVPKSLSECLQVLLIRAVAEAEFCSLGDLLDVYRIPMDVVTEPLDWGLEAWSKAALPQAQASPEWTASLVLAF